MKILPIFKPLINKNSIQNPTKFHGGLFELEMEEILTTAFISKTLTWTWRCLFGSFNCYEMFSLKMTKKLLKSCKPPKNLYSWHSRRCKKNNEKRERKLKNRKHQNSQTTTITVSSFTFCIWEKYILFQNIVHKNLVYTITFVLWRPYLVHCMKCPFSEIFWSVFSCIWT